MVYSWVKEDKPQTHRTVREISPERGIHWSSVSRSICKDVYLKCFKRCSAQELADANCAARMKRAKLLLQKFLQYATDFVFFTDKKVFSVTSPDSWLNKVSGRLWELLKKKLSVFFSAATAWSATAWPPVNCACVLQVLNTLLTPHFVQLVSGNSSVDLFAQYPFIYKLFIKILSSSLNTMLTVDKNCSDVCCDEFLMPQIDHKSK